VILAEYGAIAKGKGKDSARGAMSPFWNVTNR
jgi:hypothetical protein